MSYKSSQVTIWTPSTTWNANTTWTGHYNIYGKIFEGIANAAFTGAPDTGSLNITLPLRITQLIPDSTGNGWDGSIVRGPWNCAFINATTVQIYYNTDATSMIAMSRTAPFTIANGHALTFIIRGILE